MTAERWRSPECMSRSAAPVGAATSAAEQTAIATRRARTCSIPIFVDACSRVDPLESASRSPFARRMSKRRDASPAPSRSGRSERMARRAMAMLRPVPARATATKGYARVGDTTASKQVDRSATSVKAQIAADCRAATSKSSEGSEVTGAAQLSSVRAAPSRDRPRRVWNRTAHHAGEYGACAQHVPPVRRRSFPFPKSLYAVEDALRFFVGDKPDAVVLDFFAGSGTTAHAVMRLNKQDGGRRRSISVTNNEVSADEQTAASRGRAPTRRPRVGAVGHLRVHHQAAHQGGDHRQDSRRRADQGRLQVHRRVPDGGRLRGERRVLHADLRGAAARRQPTASSRRSHRCCGCGQDLAGAGSTTSRRLGRRRHVRRARRPRPDRSRSSRRSRPSDSVRIAFIVTDEDRLFETVARELPDHVEPVRLYEVVPAQLRDRDREERAVKFTLKDYQADAVDDVLANLERAKTAVSNATGEKSSFSLTAPTGAGKTVMAAAVIEALFYGNERFDFEPTRAPS